MEVSLVRKRLQQTIKQSRERAQQRRAERADAQRAYATFLDIVATPVTRQLQTALNAEGHHCTVFTPSGGLRLELDRGRGDYIEFALDLDASPPQAIVHIVESRGSRTVENERPVRAGAPLDSLTDDDVLTLLLDALTPWLER